MTIIKFWLGTLRSRAGLYVFFFSSRRRHTRFDCDCSSDVCSSDLDGVELTVGQGAKPGTGGVLLGSKVSPEIAAHRELPPGVDQRSPARHPDWLGPDDMILKIEELREATDWQVPIFVKLGATRVYDDVKLAAKAGADVVVVEDRKSTRLNSSHSQISYAVFCLKKKKKKRRMIHHSKKKRAKKT